VRSAAAIVLALGLAAAGCSGSGTTAGTQLHISALTGAESALVPSRATLRCDGAAVGTGFLRETAPAACAAVNRGVVGKVAARQRDRRLCAQIYGGPQTAGLRGTVDHRHVDLTVTRTDGCGVADWHTLEALLGDPQRPGVGRHAPAAIAGATISAR
jgi:hypothetical protein